MTRTEILAQADKIVSGERQRDYGKPEDNFARIAELWDAYLGASDVVADITAADVAVMMCLLKIARIRTGEEKLDNWIDLAGYAACGGEIATEAKK